MCESDRIQRLEEAVARQAVEIDSLSSLLADLLVSHAMTTGDMRPLNALRDRAKFARQRIVEGGTDRFPPKFFEARCEAFATVLENVHSSDLPSRYWVRSSWEWLDNRRYQQNSRMRAALDKLADWQT